MEAPCGEGVSHLGRSPDSAASAQGSKGPSKIATAQALPPQVGLSTLSHLSLKPLLQHPYTGGPWEPQRWGVWGVQRGRRLAHQAGRWGRLAEASTYGDPTSREAAPTPPSHPRTSPSCRPVWCPSPSSLGSSWGWGDAGRPGAEGEASGPCTSPPPGPSQCGKLPPLPHRSARAACVHGFWFS